LIAFHFKDISHESSAVAGLAILFDTFPDTSANLATPVATPLSVVK
jgi:hypothetical protein